MTVFIRLLHATAKREELLSAVNSIRAGQQDSRVFFADVGTFKKIPGAPFSYWVGEKVRDIFVQLPPFESQDRVARGGLQSSDDFRFLRTYWECGTDWNRWVPFAKGGTHSPYFADVYMVVNWANDGEEIKAWAGSLYGGWGHWSRKIANTELYFKPGLFQTLRAARLAPHITPVGCIFGDNGTQAFCDDRNLFANLAILNSSAADTLHKLLLGRAGYALYRNGTLARLPIPDLGNHHEVLSELANKAVTRKRALSSTDETSHAFLLPLALRVRVDKFDPAAINEEVARIQTDVDAIAFDLYGFSLADREAAMTQGQAQQSTDWDSGESEVEGTPNLGAVDAVLSWAIGVAFGRFDWRLATGAVEVPTEPSALEPIPKQSVGRLPDHVKSFHANGGILVDKQGHPHDLARAIEEVFLAVQFPVPGDVRRWLQQEFFDFHLKLYSKSRRKAPIYWPLSTASGSYTLWVYYARLSSQTLYTAVNDFVEPNLREVGAEVTSLRMKGAIRTRDDERLFEARQAFELELIELRDTLLKLAPTYKPNHDDGVQLSAAPLWSLFRHKPWQKILKDTWARLEKGDYDWAHLAMNYWPDRVREKCKNDKSLAIAHGLEHLYVAPEAKPRKAGGRKKAGDAE